MKNKAFLSIFFISIILFGGAYFLINSIFPVAPPPISPSAKDIISFHALYDNEHIDLSDISFGSILMCLKKAEPTRQMSGNDQPDVRPYYEIIVNTETQQYNYFIYHMGSRLYLEISYYGIYQIDGYVLDLLQ